MSELDNSPLFDACRKLDIQEAIYENPQITLSRKEIFYLMEEKIKKANKQLEKTSELSDFERKLIFVKRCILREVLDDLLCVPEDARGWTTNETLFLKEMNARNKNCDYFPHS